MYFEGPDHLSRFKILFVYCEDPNFVITVAYKIQFVQSLLELDTSSSVAFKTARVINTTTTRYQGKYHRYFSGRMRSGCRKWLQANKQFFCQFSYIRM